MKKPAKPALRGAGTTPFLFFSYSTAEPTHHVLSAIIWIVFHNDYALRFTPSSLTSGQSQLRAIEKQIRDCTFAIVCLDGLRPNVIHEYGYMRGIDKPVILLKEKNATVDVRHFLTASGVESANPANPLLVMDSHLSNLKDINYAKWFSDNPPQSAKAIWDEYEKMKKDWPKIAFANVKEPHLW